MARARTRPDVGACTGGAVAGPATTCRARAQACTVTGLFGCHRRGCRRFSGLCRLLARGGALTTCSTCTAPQARSNFDTLWEAGYTTFQILTCKHRIIHNTWAQYMGCHVRRAVATCAPVRAALMHRSACLCVAACARAHGGAAAPRLCAHVALHGWATPVWEVFEAPWPRHLRHLRLAILGRPAAAISAAGDDWLLISWMAIPATG